MRCILCFCIILFCSNFSSAQISDTVRLREHLNTIIQKNEFRTHDNPDELNRVANYIHSVFIHYSDSVWFQSYTVNGITYKNVICSFGTQHSERIIIGAHYDVCENQQGADDNASGTVGLLELARQLKDKNLNNRIDLVAYTLEEPPFFRTKNMGSHIHAKYLYDNKIPVKGMICLEMIGYFSDEKKSQDYPLGILRLFYGSKGNYITVVQKFGNGKFGRRTKRTFKKQNLIRSKSIKAPSWITGIDFSDHLNYWKYGFSAIMITDTSFYRNKNYHEKSDSLETLSIQKIALVIDQVLNTVILLK